MKSIAIVVAAGLVAVSVAGVSAEESQLAWPEHRPYITEVGKSQPIDQRRLQREMAINQDLRKHIDDYGYPEAAEIQEIVPDWPWAAYEVRLYYLRYDQELAYGQTLAAPSIEYGLEKYSGPIRPEDRRRLASRVPLGDNDVYARVAAAAERAARAAERAEADSRSAAQAAERTESVIGKMEVDFHRQLRK